MDKVLFSINDFKIMDNATYRLKQKKDSSAPNEMQEKGFSKYPGTGTTVKCRFLGEVYDTGFDSNSPMYNDVDSASKISKQRKDNVLLPYLKMLGLDETRYKMSSFKDWDSFRVELSDDKVFRTANIRDRLELYIALVSNSVVPSGKEEFEYIYDGADYVLESSLVSTKAETDNKRTRMKVTSDFNAFMEMGNPDVLIDILVYLGFNELSSIKRIDDELLITYLDNKILTSISRSEQFLELSKKSETNDGKKELSLHRTILNSLKSKDVDFAKDGGNIIYKGTELGRTEKEAAKMLVENKNLENLKFEITNK